MGTPVSLTALTINMMWKIVLLGLFSQSALADVASFTEKFQLGGKQVTCNLGISYSGGQLDAPGCSVSCSMSGKSSKSFDKSFDFDFTVGDTPMEMLNVKVGFKLVKAKANKNTPMKTQARTYTASSIDAGEATYPSDLWCPQEDTLIYTASNSVVSETSVATWQDCAQACSELRNEAGNAPCFSWTFNSGAADSLGLGAGVCRLLPYENVFRVGATDVQSGFHKCWAAYQTYSP